MDHVSANKMLSTTERENISGARVFDGEDQGKFNRDAIPYVNILKQLLTIFEYIGAGNRYRMQQLQQ